MKKYINILLLTIFVIGATVDIAVIDAVELQHEQIDGTPQKLLSNVEQETNIDKELHCADHCLHHLIPITILDIKHTVELNVNGISFGNYTMISWLSKPSTPPPLYQLS